MDKRGGENQVFPKFFLSHSAEKSRRGTLLCFTKFRVAKKFMDKGEGRRRMYQNFPSNIFVSQCRKVGKGTL